jgi:hypothetical protein
MVNINDAFSAHGFDFVCNHKLMDGDWVRPAIVCRKEMNPMDVPFYSMSVPSVSELPEGYDSNCLLVKLPKKTYNHRDDQFYGEGLDCDKVNQSTIKLFMASQVDPRSDSFFEYYIFVFGGTMEFDNSIFSSGDLVKSSTSNTLHEKAETGLDFDLLVTSLEWTIALKDKGYRWNTKPKVASATKKKVAARKKPAAGS